MAVARAMEVTGYVKLDKMNSKLDLMLEKQDVMIEKQDGARDVLVGEVRGLRSDMRHQQLDRSLDSIEVDVVEIKAKIGL